MSARAQSMAQVSTAVAETPKGVKGCGVAEWRGLEAAQFQPTNSVDVCAINVSTRQIDECVRSVGAHTTKGRPKPPTILSLSLSPLVQTPTPGGPNGSAAKGVDVGNWQQLLEIAKSDQNSGQHCGYKTTASHRIHTPRTPAHPHSASPLAQLAFLITRRASGLLSLSNKRQQQQAQPFRTLWFSAPGLGSGWDSETGLGVGVWLWLRLSLIMKMPALGCVAVSCYLFIKYESHSSSTSIHTHPHICEWTMGNAEGQRAAFATRVSCHSCHIFPKPLSHCRPFVAHL